MLGKSGGTFFVLMRVPRTRFLNFPFIWIYVYVCVFGLCLYIGRRRVCVNVYGRIMFLSDFFFVLANFLSLNSCKALTVIFQTVGILHMALLMLNLFLLFLQRYKVNVFSLFSLICAIVFGFFLYVSGYILRTLILRCWSFPQGFIIEIHFDGKPSYVKTYL